MSMNSISLNHAIRHSVHRQGHRADRLRKPHRQAERERSRVALGRFRVRRNHCRGSRGRQQKLKTRKAAPDDVGVVHRAAKSRSESERRGRLIRQLPAEVPLQRMNPRKNEPASKSRAWLTACHWSSFGPVSNPQTTPATASAKRPSLGLCSRSGRGRRWAVSGTCPALFSF